MGPHDVMAEFLVQAHDQLDRLELDLIAIERNPPADRLIHRASDGAHALATNSAALGFTRLSTLMEAAEAVLVATGRGDVQPGAHMVDALLTGADAAREALDAIEATGVDVGCDVSGVLAMLDALAVRPERPPAGALGEVLVEAGMATEVAVSLARHAQEVGDPRLLGEILVAQGSLTSPQLATGLDAQNDRRALLERAVREDAELLDGLLGLVEELAGRRDEVLSWAGTLPEGPLRTACHRLDAAVEDVRAGVRRTRLRRLADACDRLPRVVRDVAAATGKVVCLQAVDGELELPRAVLHLIRDPLTVLVRNAVDHGIEPPAARRFASKGVTGTIRLCAAIEGDSVAIEVSDDGAGIDPMQVRGTALARGLLGAYELARLTDDEVIRLVMLPGLAVESGGPTSTGASFDHRRGAGLALVRETVKSVGGEIDIWSQVGIGTSVRLTVPLRPCPGDIAAAEGRSRC